jgi:hypothetical protein
MNQIAVHLDIDSMRQRMVDQDCQVMVKRWFASDELHHLHAKTSSFIDYA